VTVSEYARENRDQFSAFMPEKMVDESIYLGIVLHVDTLQRSYDSSEHCRYNYLAKYFAIVRVACTN
jgi:hypothetical protein